MIKVDNIAALLVLSSVAILPACSMFGGNKSSSQSSRSSYAGQSYAAPPPSYTSGQTMSSTELTPDMIRDVQQTLAQGGTYQGRIDGVWGPQTEAAVRD